MVQKTLYKVEYKHFKVRKFVNYDDAAKYLRECKELHFERKLAAFAMASPFIFICLAVLARVIFA